MGGFRPLWEQASKGEAFTPLQRKAQPLARQGASSGFAPLIPGRMGATLPNEAERGSDEPLEFEPAPPPEEEPDEAEQDEQDEPQDEPENIALLKAREEGFALGRQEGIAAGQAEIEERLARLDALAETLCGLREKLFTQSASDIGEAVSLIAEAVLRRELSVDRSGIEELVMDVLEHVRGDDEVVIHIAPEDEELLQNAAPRMLERLGRDATFRMDIDASLSPGGTRIATRHGSIDATVETRFAAYADAVTEWTRDESRPR